MATEPTPPSNRSWREITARAAAEAPPEIDVRFSVRRRIEFEPTPAPAPGILDGIAGLVSGFRGAAATCAAVVVLALLGWQALPAVRDLAFALQIQNELLTGL